MEGLAGFAHALLSGAEGAEVLHRFGDNYEPSVFVDSESVDRGARDG